MRLGMPPDRSADDPALGRANDWDQLRRALAQLPPRQRTVLALRNYEDLPDATIAELMGCAPGTVRSQAARGLAALRPLLEPEGVHEGATRERRGPAPGKAAAARACRSSARSGRRQCRRRPW